MLGMQVAVAGIDGMLAAQSPVLVGMLQLAKVGALHARIKPCAWPILVGARRSQLPAREK